MQARDRLTGCRAEPQAHVVLPGERFEMGSICCRSPKLIANMFSHWVEAPISDRERSIYRRR